MLGKIKKVFFGGVFGVLYISFVAQMVYILGWVSIAQGKFSFMALLALEWFLLIAARYLSRRSSTNTQRGSFGGRRH